MSAKQYSKYQQQVIGRYYKNQEPILLQRLQELVTELYLADTAAKQNRLWQRVEKAIAKLKIPPSVANHILRQRSVEILAKNLEDWLKKPGKKHS